MKFNMKMFKKLENVLNGTEDMLVCNTVTINRKKYLNAPDMFDMRMFRRDTHIKYLKNAVDISHEKGVASASMPRLAELLVYIECLSDKSNDDDVDTTKFLHYNRKNIPIILNYLNDKDSRLGQIAKTERISNTIALSNDFDKSVKKLLGYYVNSNNIIRGKLESLVDSYESDIIFTQA